MEVADAGGGIEIMFLIGSEEARADPAFLDAAGIGDTSAGGGYEVVGDVAGEGEGNPDSHNDDVD